MGFNLKILAFELDIKMSGVLILKYWFFTNIKKR